MHHHIASFDGDTLVGDAMGDANGDVEVPAGDDSGVAEGLVWAAPASLRSAHSRRAMLCADGG